MNKPSLKYHCPEHPDRPPFCSIGDYTPCRECYYKLRGLRWIVTASLVLFLASACVAADLNDLLIFVKTWLTTRTITETVFDSNSVGGLVGTYIYQVPGGLDGQQTISVQTNDPNGLGLHIHIWNSKTWIVNLQDFIPISRTWEGLPKPVIVYYIAPRKYDDIYHSIDCFARGKPLFGWSKEEYSVAKHGIRRPCESCLNDLYLEWWMAEQLKAGGNNE